MTIIQLSGVFQISLSDLIDLNAAQMTLPAWAETDKMYILNYRIIIFRLAKPAFLVG